jgi:hypothetical protein
MLALALHFSRRIFMRCQLSHALRAARVSTGLIALACCAGCQEREIRLTDFSKTVKLAPPAAGASVVGLILQTELNASAPIGLNIGCNGAVNVRLTVPHGRKSTQRIDWYSDCAEVSFTVGRALAKSLTIHYRFQTL